MADENTSTSNEGSAGAEDAGTATDTGGHEGAEQLGDAGKKALDAERRAKAAAEKQAKAESKRAEDLAKKLQQYEDAQKSEADKLTERATAAEKQAAEAQQELLRYRVARDKKIPALWVDRLRGGTQEELESDADQLLEALGSQQQRQTPNYDGGVRQTAKPTDMNTLIRQQAGLG